MCLLPFGMTQDQLIALVVPLILLIAWFSRLEAKVSTNSRDIEKLDTRQNTHEIKLSELDSKVMDKLLNIEKMVANIQGQMSK